MPNYTYSQKQACRSILTDETRYELNYQKKGNTAEDFGAMKVIYDLYWKKQLTMDEAIEAMLAL